MSAGEQRITNTKNTCPASPSPPAAEEMDEAKLQEFLGKIMSDVGGAMSAVLVILEINLGCIKQWRMPKDHQLQLRNLPNVLALQSGV